MAESIEQLRIYVSARELEDRTYELVKAMSPERQYPLGNDLRRASSAVSHHIHEAHGLYSYRQKLDRLETARRAIGRTQRLLADCPELEAAAIGSDYIGVMKQAWGLIKYLQRRREERLGRAKFEGEARAKDEQVAARVAA